MDGCDVGQHLHGGGLRVSREQFRALGLTVQTCRQSSAPGDGEIEAGLVLGRAAAFLQERSVDLLNVNSAILTTGNVGTGKPRLHAVALEYFLTGSAQLCAVLL